MSGKTYRSKAEIAQIFQLRFKSTLLLSFEGFSGNAATSSILYCSSLSVKRAHRTNYACLYLWFGMRRREVAPRRLCVQKVVSERKVSATLLVCLGVTGSSSSIKKSAVSIEPCQNYEIPVHRKSCARGRAFSKARRCCRSSLASG
jgi:hypothetical protein